MAASADSRGETPVDVSLQNAEIFPGFSNVNEFSQQSLRMVLQATKASNDLPTGDDYDFYSTYDAVRDVLDFEARRTLQLVQTLLRHQNVKGVITGTDHPLEVDEQLDVLIDSNDQIFERVGTWIDEATGVKKNETKLVVSAVSRPNPAVAGWNKKNSSPGNSPSAPFRLLASRTTQRPQLTFHDKIDNTNRPFIPVLKHKPNALKSLEESMRLPEGVTLEDMEQPDFVFPHPYQYELDMWQPSPDQLDKVVPQEAKSLADVPLRFIDTQAGLSELCDLLEKEKEIAVDLEHHSYRTFQGFACLMQISTRDKDYLIDTIALRSDMYLLNKILTNPHITKVFHGADSDMEWLQRDFGVYVVNMFDTGQAARVLNMARFSLAHLLHIFCQIDADKQYQLADWRIRPLPDELVQYARQDTHYLLYIYDCLRNDLISRGNDNKNLLQSVYHRSKTICLKVYKKVPYREDSHLELYTRSKKVFNSQQMQALKRLFAWRDGMARVEDESVQYVLPNHMLLQIAEILPRERQGVFACCNPIPPLVRQAQHEIHAIIMEAREAPLVQVEQVRIPQPSASQHPRYYVHHCPHDLSHQQPSALDKFPAEADPLKATSQMLTNKDISITVLEKPLLSALGTHTENNQETGAKRAAAEVRWSFLSPFFMYFPRDSSSHSPEKRSTHKTIQVSKWRLKQNTDKRKHKDESNSGTFEPEFVPPGRKVRTAPVLSATTAGRTAKTSQTSSEMVVVTKGEEETSTLRQQKEKKRQEMEREMAKAATSGTNQVTGRQKLTPKSGEKKRKKKKKLVFSPTAVGDMGAAIISEQRKEKKKKKKEKEDEVAENADDDFTPFDYAAADKSAMTGEKKPRIHKDIYNPKWQEGDKKQKKRNKFGSQQRKSLTYSKSSR